MERIPGLRTTEILRKEHGWIRLMAECLEKLAAEARADQQLAPEGYELLHLYESFADGRHQQKEEDALFPELLARADDRDRATLGRLLEDHEAERERMATMRLNLIGAVQGEPLCVRSFARAATEYMDLHRGHMQRETLQLLPMAERLLDAAGDARVTAAFERIEGGAGDPHCLLEQILRLRERVGLPIPPAA